MSLTTYTLDSTAIIASDSVATFSATIVAGADLAAGTILGRITASRKFTACDADAIDGSATPIAVLLEDAEAADADVIAAIGKAGTYVTDNATGLTTALEDLLEARGIYFV